MSSAWQRLSLYESIDLVSRYYQEKHGTALEKEKGNEIVSFLAQGREFFAIAKNAAEIVRPLILYYGVVALSRGLILYLQPESRETTLKHSHGLDIDDWKNLSRGAQELPNLKIKTTTGTFSDLYSATQNGEQLSIYKGGVLRPRTSYYRTDPDPLPSGTRFSNKDILARIPDLDFLYERTFLEFSECFKAGVVLSSDLKSTIIEIRQTSLGLREESDIRRAFKLQTDVTIEKRLEERGDIKTYNYVFTLNHPTQLDMNNQLPMIINDKNGAIYLISPLADGIPSLSSLLSMYAISFVLSVLARYYPTAWISIINRSKGDFVYPIMKAALSLIEERFPEKVLTEFDKKV